MATLHTCPRCQTAFACGVDDPAPCACTTVQAGAATLARLRARYVGCLCVRCLAEEARQDGELARPVPPVPDAGSALDTRP